MTNEVLANMLQNTQSFIMEHAPKLLSDIIKWEYIYTYVWLGIAIVFLISTYFLISYAIKKRKDDWEYDHPGCVILWGISIMIWLFCPIILVCGVLDLIQLSISPELVILDYFKSIK